MLTIARGRSASYRYDDPVTMANGSHKIRHRIRASRGKVLFFTRSFEGVVDVCFRSLVASTEEPIRFALNISQAPTANDPFFTPRDSVVQQAFHISPITNELRNMERTLQELSIGVESNRARTVGYHRLTLSLSQAVRYWPILKIVIMVITGSWQVMYIVRYMKTIWLFD
jgi:emp24/gp25L/p24 family/GOLD